MELGGLRRVVLAAALAVSLMLAACATEPTDNTTGITERRELLYVSIGDSYAAGVQASGPGRSAPTRNGYADQLVDKARDKGYELELVNFGCPGATTVSMATVTGCRQPAPGGEPYADRPQAAAALDFLREHSTRVGVVTVSIGGNDVLGCVTTPAVLSCVSSAVERMNAGLGSFVRDVRAAAGPDAHIVGITYPDVVLAAWVSGQPAAQDLARLSVGAFRTAINPALQTAYKSAGAEFVDVTEASGAYRPLTETTSVSPYGVIPIAVAEVCRLTFACRFRDIHPTTEGYTLIADLIAVTLPPPRGAPLPSQ